MIKTLTLDGLTSVTIKQSAYDMARFCWLYNHSESDIFASCVNSECTENADNVLRIPAGEPRMLDTESYETLYLNGSGTVELITSAYSVCPFKRGGKGGGTSLSGSASYTINNAVDYPLMGLNLYGKSTQDGMPTPETPVDIISVGDSGSVEITADNGEKSTAATITSALPLCGIPVESGGNYTDSTGQQWVCDTLVYNADGTGKIVKRTKLITIDGINSKASLMSTGNGITQFRSSIDNTLADFYIINNSFCSHLPFESYVGLGSVHFLVCNDNGNVYIRCYAKPDDVGATETELNNWLASQNEANTPFQIIAALKNPQEIELTSAEVDALRTLQAFDGVTSISNSAGAEMSVKYCTNKALSEYVLPIFNGLQAQIDELKSAVLSLGGNI